MIEPSPTHSRHPPPGSGGLPQHVAVIMDGNGRWAQRQGLERVRELVAACGDHGIPCLTLFAFSSENWRRPEQEVRLLMDLFLTALGREVQKLHENNVRFRVIGDTARFGPRIGARIQQAERLTQDNTALTLMIAANYGGRWDIARAAGELARRAAAGEIRPEDITPESLEPHLSLNGCPEPDLFIRTGGEQRISNFLLWQLAYTELYFTPVLWPDFDRAQFEQALLSFAARERRFGMTGEQIEAVRHA
jgi:undecaprenyl diphosphate synthase